MAKYELTSPDGQTYEVNAPDNASETQVFNYFKKNMPQEQAAPQAPPQQAPQAQGEQWLPGRISERLQQRAETTKGFVESHPGAAQLPSKMLVNIGQVAGGVTDVLGETAKSAYKTFVPQESQERVGEAFRDVMDTDMGRFGLHALKKGGEIWGNFKSQHPDAALQVESAANVGLTGTGGKAIGETYKGAKYVSGKLLSSQKALSHKLSRTIKKGIDKGIRPTVVGKHTRAQVRKYDANSEKAVTAILENKNNLNFADEAGRVTQGKLPENLNQFAESIEQTKSKIFEEYDFMARDALETITPRSTVAMHKGVKVNPAELKKELDGLGGLITKELDKAGVEESIKLYARNKSKSSGLGYGKVVGESQKEWQKRALADMAADGVKVTAAETTEQAAKLTARKASIEKTLTELQPAQAMVELKGVNDELLKIANSKVLKDNAPDAARYAKQRASTYAKRVQYTTEETQEAIKVLNQSLESYYKNPTYDAANKAYIDALVANNMRKSLDEVIESATGPGYKDLKKKYGALKGMEKEVNHRAVVAGRANKKGLLDFTDILSGDRVVMGIMTANPAAMTQGALIKFISSRYKAMNNPNNTIKAMFADADKIITHPNYVQRIK